MATKNYLLLALLFLSASLAAQEPGEGDLRRPDNFCGTPGYSPWLTWFLDNKEAITSQRDVDTAWLYVPVTMHILGNNDGSGYHPVDQAVRAVCEMNDQFAEARIRYYLLPGESVVYHNNSTWNDHDWSGGQDMIESTRLPNRLNIYIVLNPAGNCGYSWLDAIVMSRSCSGVGNSTWAHEAGHHLSLPHPFFGWEGHSWDFTQPAPEEWDNYEVEKMDGSNCYNSGDRFCDTRPDYLNYRWQCNSDKESTVVQRDPNGVEFRSDASLIMGYSYDECSSRFTAEQMEAMRNNLYDEHSEYLQESTPGPMLPDSLQVTLVSPIDSAIEQFNNVQLVWEPVPNATFYQVQIGIFDNFIPIVYNTTVFNTTTHLVPKSLPKRTLFWRVRAYNEWDVCQPQATTYGVFKTKDLSSTNELEQVAEISLAPNPVSGGQPAILNISNGETLDLRMLLYDATGRLCSEQRTRAYTGDNRLEIPTDHLNPGLYFLNVQTDKGSMVKRLLVAE